MYRVSSYFLAKIMTELIPGILLPVIQSCIVYFVIGFDTDPIDKFFKFCLIIVCMANQMSGLGYMLGASIADKQVINILTPVLIVPLMLFAGFFVS